MLYCLEWWAVKNYVSKLSMLELRMLKWMSGNMLRDRINNMWIYNKLGSCFYWAQNEGRTYWDVLGMYNGCLLVYRLE